MKKKNHKIAKRVLAVLLLCVLIAGGYMAYWIHDTYKPEEQALKALESDEQVAVTEDGVITFTPKEKADKAFIFYPGGLVEPESYAPLCRKIAEQGYLVIIAKMKLNLAVLSPDEAGAIIESHPEITTWAIGGHSLGGVMASDYARDDQRIKGVVFYAAYPKDEAFANTSISALSIYGDKDGVASLDKIKGAALPKGAEFVEIKGGNHSGFGSYGMQKGDSPAEISFEEQQNKAAKATADFLKQL